MKRANMVDDCGGEFTPPPGRTIKDSERTPLGLGWEHARRGEDPQPPSDMEKRKQYMAGFNGFVCTNAEANEAMLTKGVEMGT